MKLARAVNVAIFVLFKRYVTRAFFSCFQSTDEEGIPSKRLVHHQNSCAQIGTFLLYLSSALLRGTVSSNLNVGELIRYPSITSTGLQNKNKRSCTLQLFVEREAFKGTV